MPSVICIVSCVKQKKNTQQQAKDLYISDWFIKAARYAEITSDQWYIVSAKYGLLDVDEIIEPYDLSLRQMTEAAKSEWSRKVFQQLVPLLKSTDDIVFLAGIEYRKHLIKPIEGLGCKVVIPMKGLRIGGQKKWLKNQLEGK